MKHVLEVIGDAFIVTCGAWIFFALSLMWSHGRAGFCEPSTAILTGETIASALIMLWGGERLADDALSHTLHVREFLGNITIIGFGAFCLYMFTMIRIYDVVYFGAGGAAGLVAWSAGGAIITILGLDRLIDDLLNLK